MGHSLPVPPIGASRFFDGSDAMKNDALSEFAVAFALILTMVGTVAGEEGAASKALGKSRDATDNAASDAPSVNMLSADEQSRVDSAVERAFLWLAAQQRQDGSFPTLEAGQPAVTCLCGMAFLAHGYVPGDERYGVNLEFAVDYVLGCQKENGLITVVGPDGPEISRQIAHELGFTAAYNHAISSLMLSELYRTAGTVGPTERIEEAIRRSIAATLQMQQWPKGRPEDHGGWRYVDDFSNQDSDLSITGWSLLFLRSAKTAGFDVPQKAIDDGVAFSRRTFSKPHGAFGYLADVGDHRSRGMAGAGILAFAHAGLAGEAEAIRSAEWIMRQNFEEYNRVEKFTQEWFNDRYHYGLFNCCQGMYQLGGKYWEEFYPRAVRTVLANQQDDGSWPAESHFYDGRFGNAYTTALVLLTLSAPNQQLPIYQRQDEAGRRAEKERPAVTFPPLPPGNKIMQFLAAR